MRHVARSPVPRKCFRDLTCNPFRRRSLCDVDPHELSAVYPHDDECIEKVETDRRDDEEVHGGNIWSMIAQEGDCVRKTRERHAVGEMKDGPSESPCRRRLQTAMSCFGKNPRW